MTDFRFLHAADIHLDSPLVGLARYEGLPADEIRRAPRAAFDNLVQCACQEAVDFVVIAGDLFDGAWRDMSTGLYFARAMGRLEKAGIAVYLLHGNHDAASVLTKSIPWPANVRRFGSQVPQTFEIASLGVALHGWSFAEPVAPDNLACKYPPAVEHMFNIGVLHTSLSGHPQHARYAPCEIADLRARGYDYWALGHVHDFLQACEAPPVIFPGNLQGRHIREAGPKGAVLVDVHDRVVHTIRPVELDVVRWARVIVDCGGCESLDAVYSRTRQALAKARASASAGRGLIVRIILDGETPLADTLTRRQSELRDDIRALSAALAPDLWLEKLSIHVHLPVDAPVCPRGDDLVAMLAGAEDDADLHAALKYDLAAFLSTTASVLPPDPNPEVDDLRQIAASGDWKRLAAMATAALRARLRGTD